MNIKAEILREHSKPQAMKIAGFIGSDKKKFAELMKLFLDDKYRVTQRAAWIVSHCADNHPTLIAPYIESILNNLKSDTAVAIKRNTVRILQFVDIPDSLLGLAADKCFEMLQSNKEPIAVKVFSMTILSNICIKVPELANELSIIIEDQMPHGSTGFRNRGGKILKKLSKMKQRD